MNARQPYETHPTVSAQSASQPRPCSTSTETAEQTISDPPPEYQTAIATPSAPSERENIATTEAELAPSPGPTTLTIDDQYVVSSASPQEPIYSLSRQLDGHELSNTGIMLTRIEQRPLSTPKGKRRVRAKRRDVFALRGPAVPIGLATYQIDGERFLSQRKGHMSKRYGTGGQGWSASGKGLPSFGLRSVKLPTEEGKRGYEWRDNETGRVIAMETRRSWDEKNKVELTPPRLELKMSDNAPAEYMDFLVAAWCMHNWREAKEIAKEPLTWEEFKAQAKTTAKNNKNRRWNLGMGGFGAGVC